MPLFPTLRWLALLGCISTAACDVCTNDVVADVPSADTKKRVVIFERSCGATTGFSIQVSILNAGERLADAGNTFIVDSDHGAVGNLVVTARWRSAEEVVIRYPATAPVFRKEGRLRGIAVSYEATQDQPK